MQLQYVGINALVRIVSHLMFIYFSFWSLKSLNLETLFRRQSEQARQIRGVLLLLSIAIGYAASSCFLELLLLFKNLFPQMN